MKKGKWRQRLTAMLVMALLAGVAGGCGKGQQTSGEQEKTKGESGAEKGRYVEREGLDGSSNLYGAG